MKKTIMSIFILTVLFFSGFYFFRLRGRLKEIDDIEKGQGGVDIQSGILARNKVREKGILVAEGEAKLVIEADEGIIFSVYAPDETTTDMSNFNILDSSLIKKDEDGWKFEQKNPFMGAYEIIYRADKEMLGKISIISYDDEGEMFTSTGEYSVLTENSTILLHNNPFNAEYTYLD